MATRTIPGTRYKSGYSTEFTISDSVSVFWERGDLGVYSIGVLIQSPIFFPRIRAVTDDFGDLIEVA